ncbi:MAG: ribonuclease III [Oscillospiraceae bacterium]|jgi:ribonuclease-3 family protein|nr:ribonuclease III [Oscillospiraceae bacterium]
MSNDFLRPSNIENKSEISVQALAHIGDAVYELMIRTWLCTDGITTAKVLHSRAVKDVCAKSQAMAIERILPFLSDDEIAVYKRGRNANTGSVPKGATHGEYHAATGLEALFGYLYLNGKVDRLNELFIIGLNVENK